MGLLSFLKRPSNRNKATPTAAPVFYGVSGRTSSLKSQAYDTVTPGALPQRGIYPVAGNGPVVLESLSRSHARLSETQLSLQSAPVAEHAAPSPAVPRLRDESLERPSTAPYGSQAPTNGLSATRGYRKNTPRGPPPVSFRNPRNDSSTANPTPLPHHPSVAATLVEPPAVEPPKGASSTNSGAISIQTGPDRAYKDLLDAQSEFKPADFRTRVTATGVRDYGEDVADRNLGENGFNLDSPEVQVFYASAATSLGPVPQLNELRSWPRDGPVIRPASRQSSYESGLRTKSLNSSSHYAPPQRSVPNLAHLNLSASFEATPPVDVRVPTTKSSRRQSLHTYIPTGSNGTDARARVRPSSLYRVMNATEIPHYAATPKESDTMSWNAPSPEIGAAPFGLPMSVPKPWLTSNGGTGPASSSGLRPQTPKEARDSLFLAKKRVETRSGDANLSDGQLDRSPPGEGAFSHYKPPSYSQRASVASLASHRQSRHTFHSSISSSVASYDTAVPFTPLAYPNNNSSSRSRLLREGHHVRGKSGGMDVPQLTVSSPGASADTAPLSYVATSAPDVRPGADETHDRTPSIASIHTKGHPEDTADSVPPQTSSQRRWSITSQTPTVSSTDSNSFTQSRHTADTSVDLSNGFSVKSGSRTSLNTTIANSPKKTKSASNFNIDDYISSDDDEYTPSRPRAEGEEELLFNDAGYGFDGFMLPGLPQRLGSPAVLKFDHRRQRSTSSLPTARVTQRGYGGSSFNNEGGFASRPSRRRYILDTAADSDSDGDGSESESWFDSRERFAAAPRTRRGTKRLSAIGTLYGHQYSVEDAIEEERLEKIDVAAAVKLRKETKARKRAEKMAQRSIQIKGKQPMTASEAEAHAEERRVASHAEYTRLNRGSGADEGHRRSYIQQRSDRTETF